MGSLKKLELGKHTVLFEEEVEELVRGYRIERGLKIPSFSHAVNEIIKEWGRGKEWKEKEKGVKE